MLFEEDDHANADVALLAIAKTNLDKILIMDRELGYKLLGVYEDSFKALREKNEKMVGFLAISGGF